MLDVGREFPARRRLHAIGGITSYFREGAFADPDLVSRQMVADGRGPLEVQAAGWRPAALRGLASAMFKDGRQGRNLAGELAGLKLPIQVIWGAKDAVIPAAHAKALSNARVEIIDAAGHMSQMEAAGRVNDLIKAQIAG